MPYSQLNRSILPTPIPSRPIKILQYGEGNFLRAFVDWIIYEMNHTIDFNAGVAVIQPIEHGRVDALNEQDGLYHTYLRGIKDGTAQETANLVDVIQRGINPYTDHAAYLAEADNPDLQIIVSNTTEAGIQYVKGESLTDTPQKSYPGKLAALLYRRFQTFQDSPEAGVIVLPCELIKKNGEILQSILLKIAEEWKLEEGFSQWLTDSCTFCNTLVDRIVPGYPADEIEQIQAALGYQDHSVVVGEQFLLWVIEGPESVQKVFPADQAGLNVIFTPDQLARYRSRKVRILNGAHTLMVPIGLLYGLETVRDAVEDPLMGSFLRAAIIEEIIPTLDMDKKELEAFTEEVIDRFRNPYVRHKLASIALNSTSKFKTRDLPSLITFYEQTGTFPRRLCLGLAALLVFYRGEWDGRPLPINDSQDAVEFMNKQWTQYEGGAYSPTDLVHQILANQTLWDQDLTHFPGLVEEVALGVEAILSNKLKQELY